MKLNEWYILLFKWLLQLKNPQRRIPKQFIWHILMHTVLYFQLKKLIFPLIYYLASRNSKRLIQSVSSVTQSCSNLCDNMNRSTPGLPVHHQLPEFTQTHVHRVGDAIQPSHPLSSPSPPAPNPSQHQGLFQWVNSSHQVAKILEFQLQHQSFQWTPRTDLLKDGLVGSPCSPRDSQESFPTPLFKSINSSALSFLYRPSSSLCSKITTFF